MARPRCFGSGPGRRPARPPGSRSGLSTTTRPFCWRAPAGLELPLARPRPAVTARRGAAVSRLLPEELSQRLRQLAAAAGGSPFLLLLAAFKALLHRYTGATDLVVGSPISGRDRRETE